MKRLAGIVLVLALVTSAGAFAKETKSADIPWMASYDHGGDLNLYATVGLNYWGLSVSAGPEFIISQFDAGPIPLSIGVMVRGMVSFPVFYSGYGGLAWGAAPMVSLHWGVDFGAPWKFDWYIAAGLGLYGFTVNYVGYNSGLNFGFAGAGGVAWHFSDNFALVLDSAYVGWAGTYGVGIKMKL